MSDIRSRREIEIGIDRTIEETGIDLIEGEYAAAQTCLAPAT
ncbi:hypothetical protein [Streptacidiphilus cavernicola]|uniref:Uncharacterized protein n=1 Tax=Streptacidiphilus cavernicola TaxID=3342716 RepID=A0ABV6W5Y3_9ACTN